MGDTQYKMGVRLDILRMPDYIYYMLEKYQTIGITNAKQEPKAMDKMSATFTVK